MKKQKWNMVLLVGAFILLVSSFVCANFGVGFTSRIFMEPGDTIDREFSIQNVIGEPVDTVIRVDVAEGAEYITLLEGNTYNVAAGEIKPVPIRISVPEDAQYGDIYGVTLTFKTVSEAPKAEEGEEGHAVSFKFGVGKGFLIEIKNPAPPLEPTTPTTPTQPQETGTNVWLWILGIAVLIVIAWIILRKKKDTPVTQKKKK